MHDPKEILEMCEKATPGPWYREKIGAFYKGFTLEHIIATTSLCATGNNVYAQSQEGIFPSADADFIALARTALPGLAQRVIELEADNAKLRAIAEAANDIYPWVAGRVIQLQKAGEVKAAAEWNEVAIKLCHSLREG